MQASLAAAPGLACVALARGKATAGTDDGGIRLLFDGELYDRETLLERLNKNVAVAVGTDADLCLQLLLEEGDGFVERLNGQFNLIVYRAAQRRLSIATDRFAYRPLFFTQRGSRFLFATAMKAILAVIDKVPAVDGVGFLQLMRIGWPLGDRTWLGDIRVAAPGSWLHITDERTSTSRYFRLRFEARDSKASVQEHAAGLADVLRRAVRRRMRAAERVGIGLSGGLDSRSLVLAAPRDDPPALTYTFGRADSFDVTYARRIAEIAGVRHRHFAYARDHLTRILTGVVWLTEGLNPFAHVSLGSVAFHDHLAEEVDVLLYGHCGDCLTGAHLPSSIVMRRSRSGLIEDVFRQYNGVPEETLRRVVNEKFYRQHAGALREATQDTFAGIEGESLADVLDVWDIENRQRRGTFGSNAADRHRFEVRAPFLDNDVVDHLRRARLSWRLLQVAYKRMLVTAFPEAADVPWAYTGRRLSRGLAGDFVQQGINYVDRRLRRTAGDPRTFRDLAADTRGDAGFTQRLRDFAAHAHFPSEILNRDGLIEVVEAHASGRRNLTHLVVMLATFAEAWRLFLFDSPTTIPAELESVQT